MGFCVEAMQFRHIFRCCGFLVPIFVFVVPITIFIVVQRQAAPTPGGPLSNLVVCGIIKPFIALHDSEGSTGTTILEF